MYHAPSKVEYPMGYGIYSMGITSIPWDNKPVPHRICPMGTTFIPCNRPVSHAMYPMGIACIPWDKPVSMQYIPWDKSHEGIPWD